MKKTCLFLDDERQPKDVTWVDYGDVQLFTVVRTAEAFIAAFKSMQPDIVSFDHDLGLDENGKERSSGYFAVKAAIAELFSNDNQEIPEAIFHSKNSVGSKNMRVYWKNGIREINNLRKGEF